MSFVVYEGGKFGEQAYDPASYLWKKNKILMLSEPITTEYATAVCSLLLAVGHDGDPIKMYISSPGGSIDGMFAIIDTMDVVKSPIHTVCMGGAYSAAAVILACGEAGHRKCLPHASVMLHQVQMWDGGKFDDVRSYVDHVGEKSARIGAILKERTKLGEAVDRLLSGTDLWMTAKQAKKNGIVDKIVEA